MHHFQRNYVVETVLKVVIALLYCDHRCFLRRDINLQITLNTTETKSPRMRLIFLLRPNLVFVPARLPKAWLHLQICGS